MDFDKLKKQVDTIANIVKSIEELDPSAVVLPNIQRSIQLDIFSCGAQSVYMILKHYKKKCTIGKVAKQLHTEYHGTALADIKRVLRDYGLKYRIIRRASLKDLREAIDAGYPVLISTLDGGHWSVVYGYSDDHVFVADPSVMVNVCCRISIETFKWQWDKWGMVIGEG